MRTRALTLYAVINSWIGAQYEEVAPFDGLILNLTVLVIQSLEDTVDYLGTCMIVADKEIRCSRIQCVVEIIQ